MKTNFARTTATNATRNAARPILKAILLLSFVGCTNSAPQPARSGAHTSRHIKTPAWADTNHDGVLSQSEYERASRKIQALGEPR